jgi:drug/metabolite transporter (DMT)-like permease
MLCYVGYILYTRHLAATDSAEAMILISGIVPSLMLAPVALPVAEWPPTVFVALAIVSTGLFGALGHWLLIHAQRLAPTPVLAPFLYTQLISMTVAGYVFFGQLPDRFTLIGAAIIVASALYILYRQQVHGDR